MMIAVAILSAALITACEIQQPQARPTRVPLPPDYTPRAWTNLRVTPAPSEKVLIGTAVEIRKEDSPLSLTSTPYPNGI